ncbi:hypothetical protein [Croceibacterium ferulae]|uniref:hypothetical protein n=1 Tax=Croceibacterium ferulae TaxID=1854641 RepID=UPI000F89874F|nr:hypothetical protein [Croceibacterium ferulae]
MTDRKGPEPAMSPHNRLLAATRLAPHSITGTPLNTRPDRWPGIARLSVLAALAVIGWSVILLPIL